MKKCEKVYVYALIGAYGILNVIPENNKDPILKDIEDIEAYIEKKGYKPHYRVKTQEWEVIPKQIYR